MASFKPTVDVIKGFIRLEWISIVYVLVLILLFLVQGDYVPALVSILALLWVFKASEYRQMLEELMGMLEDKPE